MYLKILSSPNCSTGFPQFLWRVGRRLFDYFTSSQKLSNWCCKRYFSLEKNNEKNPNKTKINKTLPGARGAWIRSEAQAVGKTPLTTARGEHKPKQTNTLRDILQDIDKYRYRMIYHYISWKTFFTSCHGSLPSGWCQVLQKTV